MIDVLVFDLDDTLFPEVEFVESGFRAADAWLEIRHSKSGLFDAAWRLFQRGARGRIFDLALGEMGVANTEGMIAALVSVYRAHVPVIALYPDARWAIDHYQGQKKMGMITDGYLVAQRNKVEALGIKTAFDAIVYSDQFGRENWKPSEFPYRKIMELIRCGGPECVYIADNPAKDFIAPKTLGWSTIQICRPDGQHAKNAPKGGCEADYKIADLRELQSVGVI